MINKTLKIGTRGSRLALWQANFVKQLLTKLQINSTIVPISTTGDQIQNRYLHEIGGKGLFVKEIEQALKDNTIDLAVHSLKDLPAEMNSAFNLSAFLPRENPHDVLILKSPQFKNISHVEAIAQITGLKIGTSSLRRQCFLKHLNPGVMCLPLRGNVDTRLEKLKKNSELDGIILAYAGLHRLGLDLAEFSVIKLTPEYFIPCAGQGIIAIQTRTSNDEEKLISGLNNPDSKLAAVIERRILQRLGADCKLPFGCFAKVENNLVTSIDCVVLNLEGLSCHGRLANLKLEQPSADVEELLIKKMKSQNLNKILRDLNLTEIS